MVDFELSFDIPKDLPSELPVLPLRSGVLLPGIATPFSVGRRKSLAALEAVEPGRYLLVSAQVDTKSDPGPGDLIPVATLARVVRGVNQQGGVRSVLIQGLARVSIDVSQSEPHFMARHESIPQAWPETPEAEAMKQLLFSSLEEIESTDAELPLLAIARQVDDPCLLVDLVATAVNGDDGWKREILTTLDPVVRAELVLKRLKNLREVIEAHKSIQDRVMSDVNDNNREAILRKQLEAIKKELGEEDDDELSSIRAKLDALELPEDVQKSVDKEIRRLDRLNRQSPERAVTVDWLEWIADLPWHREAASEVDLDALQQRLDETHFGLEDVKRQVIEYMAVRKLSGTGRADILLLVGPPGVGKTSIAQAIADATDRKMVRVALGGVRDEAELRGHRRTYVGARPGRIIEGLRRVSTADPVILFDEIDKLGRGWQGDPAAALLEILDPEQNDKFTDHYLEVPFDLSKALFIATANDLSEIAAPLRDRMQVLQIDGYTPKEKVAIARTHVFTKLAKNAGVLETDVGIPDEVLETIISGWTREAGVRQLQRILGKIFRAAAVKKVKEELHEPLVVTPDALKGLLGRRKFFDETHEAPARPGVAVGLAWTPMGGDVLYIEASLVPGKGKLVITGQLGDVMKESAQAALTYVMSNSDALGIPEHVLEKQDIHLHVPAGATPKDGPSAGITMYSALASLLSGRKLRGDVAMTGEATLRGRVLPVGGIKSKVLAAYGRGIRKIVLPKDNGEDLDELPADVREQLDIVLVAQMSEILPEVLAPLPKGALPPSEGGYMDYSLA